VKLSQVLFRFAVPGSTARPDPEPRAEPGVPSPRARSRRRWAGQLRIDEVDFQDTEPSVHDRYRVDKHDRSS
jgi:hypothetical protein